MIDYNLKTVSFSKSLIPLVINIIILFFYYILNFNIFFILLAFLLNLIFCFVFKNLVSSFLILNFLYFNLFLYFISTFYFNTPTYYILLVLPLILIYFYKTDNIFFITIFNFWLYFTLINSYLTIFNVNIFLDNLSTNNNLMLMPIIFLPLILKTLYFKIKLNNLLFKIHLIILFTLILFYSFLINFNFSTISIVLILLYVLFIFLMINLDISFINFKILNINFKDNFFIVILTNLIIITFSLSLLIKIFIFTSNDNYFEIEAYGATLNYNYLLGYYAKFNIPFEILKINQKLQNIPKNILISNQNNKWEIIDKKYKNLNKTFCANIVNIIYSENTLYLQIESPFFYFKLNPKQLSLISPRFVYKLKVIINNNNAYLDKFEIIGDKFLVIDNSFQYNKYLNHYENIMNISFNKKYIAIYDISGNIRIIDSLTFKIKMIIEDIHSFKNVVPINDNDFLILCSNVIYKVNILKQNLEIILKSNFEYEFNSVETNTNQQAIISLSNNKLFLLDFKLSKLIPISIELNNASQIKYFDNNILAYYDFFLQKLIIHKISLNKNNYFQIDDSFIFTNLDFNNIKITNINENEILIYALDNNEKCIFFNIFDIVNFKLIKTSRYYLNNNINSDTEFLIKYNKGINCILINESNLKNIQIGFLFNNTNELSLENIGTLNIKTPLDMKIKDNILYLLFKNNFLIINLKDNQVQIFKSAI